MEKVRLCYGKREYGKNSNPLTNPRGKGQMGGICCWPVFAWSQGLTKICLQIEVVYYLSRPILSENIYKRIFRAAFGNTFI